MMCIICTISKDLFLIDNSLKCLHYFIVPYLIYKTNCSLNDVGKIMIK